MLALTFDDGPDPRGTPAVLEALEAVGVTATFFVLGERVVAHSALLRRVIEAGHNLEVHGYEHLRHPESTRETVARDLDKALDVLADAGIEPTRWRIPWGHLAAFTPPLARERGLDIVGWTSDTHDWRGDSASAMVETLHLEYGGIVLAHDGISVGARRDTARATAELVPLLVERARSEGLAPGPLTPTWPVPIPVGNPNFHPGVVQPA
ncbi:polysaccharide deacetylase family protein [Solirubrobacter ginsenosidimutans]|uniref:Polysaccharide deacetylase family protein n=1 Tax=Solirubrobacter ginsenosidimutans TaxID=490573 RepID=A0A9X3MWL4_9ACTN|nr:polysaccharide deacetylase family protein [Solirubrobacter ginsenosidimutans]MDA0162590.1 polysaccharide deacetylase family protein [Solirubrobacter ginsenosidimutans]